MVGNGLQLLFNSCNTLLQQVYFPNMMFVIPFSVYDTPKSWGKLKVYMNLFNSP